MDRSRAVTSPFFTGALALFSVLLLTAQSAVAQGTRLLRQPTVSAEHIAFAHGGDLWVVDRDGGVARRLTSTPAMEADPHFSPDGMHIAFTSNRSGTNAVYVAPTAGGNPTRLTWHPSSAYARGWTPDGTRVLYASGRGNAPNSGVRRLWTVAPTGGPSEMIPAPWGNAASYSPDGGRMVIDRMTRWDWEWRSYRGGQNQPLVLMDLDTLEEDFIPNELQRDDNPVWLGDMIYFLSDRDWAHNVWSYDPSTGQMAQVTSFTDVDAKYLSAGAGMLVVEQDGWIHLLNPATGALQQVEIEVVGDFPWAQPAWKDLSRSIRAASLSTTGQRVLVESRGEIITLPTEDGDTRNLTRSSGANDKSPVWSPDGGQVAWFSDDGSGYVMRIGSQDGLGDTRDIDLGESEIAWTPRWSPDGSHISFVDQDGRIQVVEVESGDIATVDVDGSASNVQGVRPVWSPDSKWLAYSKSFENNYHRIVVRNVETGESHELTDALADATSPSWDRDGKHLYFLASTDLGLSSSWANTSSMYGQPSYSAYVAVLQADGEAPFPPESDEEPVEDESDAEEDEADADEDASEESEEDEGVVIDAVGFDRRIIALPMSGGSLAATHAGPEGSVFIQEFGSNGPIIHKFTLAEREAEEFARGSSASVSADGSKLLYRSGPNWHVVDTGRPAEPGQGRIEMAIRALIDPAEEWPQIYDEAWHLQRDHFYDPGMHGNDWDASYDRYRPLVDHVKHRGDLTYLLDQLNGELSVGHSFVGGGDMPPVDTVRVGLIGADLEAENGRWRITRIFTTESWNPGLDAPLDRPGLRVEVGDYLLGVDGVEMTTADDPYRLLDGTAGRQTVLHINTAPSMDDSWTIVVEPVRSEAGLRQRAWVEDNRRMVDSLSNGRIGYAWIPDTSGPGTSSFDRYVFAQQDREGLVIDERYNGGGLLDDYMVDLMTRELRAAITNEAPSGRPMPLPAGILGPKALIINERAGSGGDYFPWVFRHQNAGPLIGMRTWGGLVASCSHYPLVDGGLTTAPCSAVFDPVEGEYITENEGVPPDIRVYNDAQSVAAGGDPQLEAGIQSVLDRLGPPGSNVIEEPEFPNPSRRPGDGGGNGGGGGGR